MALVARPSSCIRRLGGTRKREMQFTRFLRNPAVTASEISAHAATGTASRVAGREVVVIFDTTEVALGGWRARDNGYGPVGKGGAARGLLLHAALAVDAATGALLGLVDANVWNRTGGKVTSRRKRKITEKESQRWLDGARRAGAVLAPACRVTGVSDRESDIYEHFASRPANMDLIVRACQNRAIEADNEEQVTLLFPFIDSLPEQGRFTVNIAAAPGRRARTAELAVRFSSVVLCRPQHGARNLPENVAVTLVDVRETSEPKTGEPVHWRLLTTDTVASVDEARRIVDLYRMRWTIEEFFRTLKTAGFDIEDANIGEPHAMMNLLTAAAVAAVTIMQLVRARDGTTGENLLDAFDAADKPILEALSAQLEGDTARQKNPHRNGTLAFAAWVIGRLGGWTGYYGKPGPLVIRRGLEDFQRIRYGTTLRLRDV
jgi:Transposase DDE domain